MGYGLGSSIGRSAATVAVDNCGNSPLPVGPQQASGVPGAYTHERGSLIQRQVFSHQAVENLESRLFLGSQSLILHWENVTSMLAS